MEWSRLFQAAFSSTGWTLPFHRAGSVNLHRYRRQFRARFNRPRDGGNPPYRSQYFEQAAQPAVIRSEGAQYGDADA